MTIAKHLEHTLLKPEATVEDIMQLCSEARKYGLFGVCVNPCYVGLARHLLSDTNVKVVTVVGFPRELHFLRSRLWRQKWRSKRTLMK